MTESTGFPPEQPQPQVPYTEAAAVAAGQVQTDAGVDAGVSLGQMATDKPAPLPNEAQMDQLMAEFKAMSDRVQQMEAELGQTRAGYAAAVAQLGPPEVATYGKAIYDKLVSFRNAHPDLPGHFDTVISKAQPLAEASSKVISGEGHVSDVLSGGQDVIDAVDRFISKTHARLSAKPIDFSAIASDLEYFVEAAAKIAAVA